MSVGRVVGVGLAVLLVGGCGEKAVERSFIDRHGRVCTYVMVEEWDGDRDVGNISCEFPPASWSPSPSATPSG
ncbi:hypothetical protein [Actinocorallia longicatena]|uniref:Uncharacterized protein n=1 Tax=Actinocorallia longicatena TaxID=111803 RepID=A0ABP6QLM7_9ACTN